MSTASTRSRQALEIHAASPKPSKDTIVGLSVVIPAYNERVRLPATLRALESFVAEHELAIEVIIVDNASTDDTALIAKQAAARVPWLRLVRIEERGKGVAVRTGMLAAAGEVVVFADADLSWCVEDLIRVPALVSDETPVVIGSRTQRGVTHVRTPFLRHLMSRIFNFLVQVLVLGGIGDTQCGFKVFRADAARAIFSYQRINGFGFDVEVLYLARRLGFPILQTPLDWEHREGSRISPARDVLKMLADIVRVRSNAALGRYSGYSRPTTVVQPAS
jgi:dolichyl-phosphate beta-glucosyltransferase